MKDYIIVGLGLSGLAVAEELEKRNCSFLVYEDGSMQSSLVAGGIFNPVILKRFTLAWNAAEQLKIAIPFYENLERKLESNFISYWNIYRRFHSIEEQNNWFAATDNSRLSPFLASDLVKNKNPNIIANYSLGKVLKTGNIHTKALLTQYRNYLESRNALIKESFNYLDLRVYSDYLECGNVRAKKIIFCEGFGLKNNPYFNYLPMQGNKGEYIIVHAPELQSEIALKSSIFLMPLGKDLYKVGATYNPQDKSAETTTEARQKLETQLKELIRCNFEVVEQLAGIRPTMVDRRPVAGRHPEYPQLLCCNGFGSHGVLIAPTLAKELVDYSEENKQLDPETNLKRFTAKYYLAQT